MDQYRFFFPEKFSYRLKLSLSWNIFHVIRPPSPSSRIGSSCDGSTSTPSSPPFYEGNFNWAALLHPDHHRGWWKVVNFAKNRFTDKRISSLELKLIPFVYLKYLNFLISQIWPGLMCRHLSLLFSVPSLPPWLPRLVPQNQPSRCLSQRPP